MKSRRRTAPSARLRRSDRVVAIGASAGGLQAFESLLINLAPGPGLTLIISQHRNPDGPRVLAGLIQSYTRRVVVEVTDGLRLERERVYVTPAGCTVKLEQGAFRVSRLSSGQAPVSIDQLFESLARELGPRAVGVVLSGTGADGVAGVKAIRAAGGTIVVQEPATAAYDGMPRNAICTGCADHVLPPEAIGDVLHELRHTRSPKGGRGVLSKNVLILTILEIVRARTNQDFAFYKAATVGRRILQRSKTRNVGGLAAYLALLQSEPGEAEQLARTLVIGVTRFFRDPPVWKAMAPIVRRMVGEPGTVPLRMWVAGCSTGEEAYSLAIQVRIELERAGSSRPVQIFATDLSRSAIQQARLGCYPSGLASQLEPALLKRFFTRHPDHYRIVDEVRHMVTFAQHDLLVDPAFVRLDLISCRNVLIYMDPRLQRKVLELFHYALLPNGCLVLGSAESVAPRSEGFDAIESRHRLFKRSGAWSPHRNVRTMMTSRAGTHARPAAGPPARRSTMKITELARRLLRKTGAASAALVDERDTLVSLHGELSGFLELADGTASLALARMVPDYLVIAVQAAVAVARTHRKSHRTDWVNVPDRATRVRVTVQPVSRPVALAGLLLITFEERSRPAVTSTSKERPAQELVRVRRELDSARNLLAGSGQNVRRAVDDAQESRHELQTATEELQSANEELETTKEELLAVNQEMEALNADLKLKVSQLAPCSADLEHLLAERRAALLSLDAELRLLRFSRGVEDLMSLRARDVGSVVGTITSTAIEAQMAAEARLVLRTLEARESTVRCPDGRWITMRIAPPRSDEGQPVAVRVIFTDVTAQRRAAGHQDLVGRVLGADRRAVAIASTRGVIEYASPQFEALAGVAPGGLLGKHLADAGTTSYGPAQRTALKKATDRQGSWNHERPVEGPDGNARWESATLSPVQDVDGSAIGLILVVEDVSERKRAENGWRGALRASRVLPAWMSGVLPETQVDGALRGACRALTEVGEYDAAWAIRCATGKDRRSGHVVRAGSWKGSPAEVAPPDGATGGRLKLLDKVARAGRSLVIRDPGAPGSTLLMALENGELTVGLLAVRATDADAFGDVEIRLLEPLARSLARRITELAEGSPS